MHKDIKPGNLLLTTDDIVKITDFGVAEVWSCTAGAARDRRWVEVWTCTAGAARDRHWAEVWSCTAGAARDRH